jgi:hypothetical protein
LADWPNLRFAVGTFDSRQQLRSALDDLRLRGLVLDSLNCLAARRVFAGKTVIARSQEPVVIEEFASPDNGELLGCTSGPLAGCLVDRLGSGARSLEDALASWLLPRHAGHFQRAIEDGKVLLWIRLADADDERWAYQCLRATSSNAVGALL